MDVDIVDFVFMEEENQAEIQHSPSWSRGNDIQIHDNDDPISPEIVEETNPIVDTLDKKETLLVRSTTMHYHPKQTGSHDSEIPENNPEHDQETPIAAIPEVVQAGIQLTGTGENAHVKFQLIPISEIPGKAAVGEVVERKLKEGQIMKLGRQVIKDGQATIKGTKKATEVDVWFISKVVSRLHAEIWTKDGQLCVKDVGSSSGTFLNQMRLSPSGKESRPYPLKQGDVLQFGVDFKCKTDSKHMVIVADVYRAVTMKVGFHDQSWLLAQRANANPQRFSQALKSLLAATNPYGKNSEESTEGDTDCCICIDPIAPFQALFIAPCSHCYHFKCVGYLISQSPMFQCPMCRQVANLTASVSQEDLNGENKIPIPLPVLLGIYRHNIDEISPPEQEEQRNPMERKKKTSLVDRLSVNLFGKQPGISSPSSSPLPNETPELDVLQSSNIDETGSASIDKSNKKRSFSQKFRSFIGGKNNSERDPQEGPSGQNIPRTAHPVPGETQMGNSEVERVLSVPEETPKPLLND